jgi:exodeoxyribonuclease V alpha subunit
MAEQLVFDDVVRIEEIDRQTVIYPAVYYRAESNVAKRLYSFHTADVHPVKSDIDELIKRSESDSGILLSENQKVAVRACGQNGVCVITGGPGTGKTTIINTIISVFESSGFSVAIAAPTGRAAKRITETSGKQAVTIHRLLEYYYSSDNDSMNFGKNEEDTLEYDVVIIDEMSMVDILLMDALTEAIVPGTRLIMVGDADQLPSVGAGNVLRDIINSEIIMTVKLTEIFRQAEESMIVVNAHRINSGEYPFCNEAEKDFFMMTRNSEMAVLGTIKELCATRLPRFYSECDPTRDIQVLTPVRKGTLGTFNMNKELQSILNPPRPGICEKEFQNRIFREGDKVMQIKNNYRLEWKRRDTFLSGEGVFNGDIGFIVSIDNEDNKLTVVYDDVKYVEYDFTQTDELELAYAMTIHKSQGSEFPVIVMPMTHFPPMLANRNLLYTGVTRGKKGVVIVGSERMLHAMIDNNRTDERFCGLEYRLRSFMILENL